MSFPINCQSAHKHCMSHTMPSLKWRNTMSTCYVRMLKQHHYNTGCEGYCVKKETYLCADCQMSGRVILQRHLFTALQVNDDLRFWRGGDYQIRQKYLGKKYKIYQKYLPPKLIRYAMYTSLQINRSHHAFLIQ